MPCTLRSVAASTTTRKGLAASVGGGVVEVITDYRGDTFRPVHTVRFRDAVYVLHAFQTKPKTGRATPHREMELIEQRLPEAERIAKRRA